MGLLEWLGEAYDPGPVGGLDVGQRVRVRRGRLVVLVRAGSSLAALALFLCLVLPHGAGHAFFCCAFLGVYLVAAHFVHPRPDTSNLGWFGGVFDHPFRWSDDANRFLLFLGVFLWPGRFVTESLAELGALLCRPLG